MNQLRVEIEIIATVYAGEDIGEERPTRAPDATTATTLARVSHLRFREDLPEIAGAQFSAMMDGAVPVLESRIRHALQSRPAPL